MSDVFDPYFIQTLELDDKQQAKASTIHTSRIIVLAPPKQDVKNAPLGNLVTVAETTDLTVYGDEVRVWGTIKAPSRKVTIFCRRLEFYSGAAGASGIEVSGEKGADGSDPGPAASAAKDGTETDKAGHAGKPGEEGKPGDAGKSGGEIHLSCETLAAFGPVRLSADGGNGGNGGQGQIGQAGGKGFDGYLENDDSTAAHGGQGGCGGNGGDGGAGGAGGTVEVRLLELASTTDKGRVTISVMGGNGGNGGTGGVGGRGGNGGNPAPDAYHYVGTGWLGKYQHNMYGPVNGADGGGGGISGFAGYGGPGGSYGAAACGVPAEAMTSLTTLDAVNLNVIIPVKTTIYLPNDPKGIKVPDGDNVSFLQTITARLMIVASGQATTFSGSAQRNGKDAAASDQVADSGTPSKKSEGWPRYYGNAWTTDKSKDGDKRPPNKERKTKGTRPSNPGAPKDPSLEHIGYKDLASAANIHQLEMLFDQVRTRYLLTNIYSDSEGVHRILDILGWLALLLVDTEKWKTLYSAVTATLNNLRSGLNIFGKDAEFAVLGSLDKYKTELNTMLGLLKPVEKTYQGLSTALNQETERQLYLENVTNQQANLIDFLALKEKELVNSLKAVVAEINTLEESRTKLADSLSGQFNELESGIRTEIGLTGADFCNLFTQLSFTNLEHGPLGLSMVASQIGDLTTKAIENAPTDTGAPLNKKYVIRRMEFLGQGVKDLQSLKTTREGLIKTDPQAEYRLQATREQVQSICSNFFEKYPSAKKITQILDDYIEAVASRNEKVEEYNQDLTSLAYVRAELDKTKAQKNEAETSRQKKSNPGLPAMANYATALYKHAKDRCIEQIYMASRVYTIELLDLLDVFADVLGTLKSPGAPGEINTAALDVALIELIGGKLEVERRRKTIRETFEPGGKHYCKTITKKENPLLFANLRQFKPGTFRLMPATSATAIDQNPFAGTADVRLTHIRCTATGMQTTDDVHWIKLTHPGIEDFVAEDDRRIHLQHSSAQHDCRYDAKTGKHQGNGVLDANHAMVIGPFCQWIVEIPQNLNAGLMDLNKLESIKVEFQGTFRGFPKHAE